LKRAGPAGPGTGRRRYDLDDGERERESQNSPDQHGHSPDVEARSGFCRLDQGTRRLFPCARSNEISRMTSPRVRNAACVSHRRYWPPTWFAAQGCAEHHGIVMDWT
jgi:hypothetical protein